MAAAQSESARADVAAPAQTQVIGVRVHGDHGFALFKQPRLGSGFFPMLREGREWKAGALGESIMPSGT